MRKKVEDKFNTVRPYATEAFKKTQEVATAIANSPQVQKGMQAVKDSPDLMKAAIATGATVGGTLAAKVAFQLACDESGCSTTGTAAVFATVAGLSVYSYGRLFPQQKKATTPAPQSASNAAPADTTPPAFPQSPRR